MKLIFIYGPSGSGKTTLSNQIIEKVKNGFVLITSYLKKILILLLKIEFQSMSVLIISKRKQ